MRKKRFEGRLLTVQPDIAINKSGRNEALLLEWTIISAHAEHAAESAGLDGTPFSPPAVVSVWFVSSWTLSGSAFCQRRAEAELPVASSTLGLHSDVLFAVVFTCCWGQKVQTFETMSASCMVKDTTSLLTF